MAKSPLKITFVLRKGTVQSGRKFVESLFKRLIYVSFNEIRGPNRPIFRDILGRDTLPVKNAITLGLTFNHHNHKNDATIEVFLQFFVQA